jgi:hypothetical protein
MDINKLKHLSSALEKENYSIYLFCALELEDYPNKLDIIIVSEQLEPCRLHSVRIVSNKLAEILNKKDLLQVSKIVLLAKDDEFVSAFVKFIEENNTSFLKDIVIAGKNIKYGYIFTSPVSQSNRYISISKSKLFEFLIYSGLLRNEKSYQDALITEKYYQHIDIGIDSINIFDTGNQNYTVN